MSYYDPNLLSLTPDIDPESYCVVFDIPRGMPPEIARQVKEQKLKELYGKALREIDRYNEEQAAYRKMMRRFIEGTNTGVIKEENGVTLKDEGMNGETS